jgi:CMP/dCMP kinase
MVKNGFVIAIDGPVASGKGTVATQLAKKLNGFYLYTGAMYRSIALLGINKGIDLEDEAAVEAVLPDLNVKFDGQKVFLNGQDVTKRLQQPDTASGASVVGVYKKVREEAVRKQQLIGQKAVDEGKVVVVEGRDTGTTVFPNASLKIFLTARPEVRARRRMEQYVQGGKNLEQQLLELKKRDKRDLERPISPLPDNPEELGYFVLDNSDMTEEQTLHAIVSKIDTKGLVRND